MRCFEVWVNGRQLYTAGIAPPGTLHGHLHSWERRPADPSLPGKPDDHAALHFGGSDPATGDYVSWPTQGLRVGDEVVIRVVDRPAPDDPPGRRPRASGEFDGYERKIYERLRAKFGPGPVGPDGGG